MLDAIGSPRHTTSHHRPASKLEEQLDAGMRDSLDYQILRRTLMPDTEAPATPVTEAASSAPAAPPPATSLANISSNTTSFQQVIEQRELQLNISSTPAPAQSDPLVLDLAGNGFSTSGLDQAVRFDLNADGTTDRISAPTGDDALLAFDRNNNGSIDDGRELFGDQHGAADGFAELSKYDDNQDGKIDRQDAIYGRLSLLQFDVQGRQRMQSLEQANVRSIQLQAINTRQALGAYDEIAQLGSFEFNDGRQGQAADLLLARR